MGVIFNGNFQFFDFKQNSSIPDINSNFCYILDEIWFFYLKMKVAI